MSKKSKKKRIRQPSVPQVSTSEPDKPTLSSRAQRSAAERDFQPDYSYVKKDLKRIALIAGSFVIILIILSFYLR